MKIRYGIEVSDEDANMLDQLENEKNYYDKIQYVMKIRLNS